MGSATTVALVAVLALGLILPVLGVETTYRSRAGKCLQKGVGHRCFMQPVRVATGQKYSHIPHDLGAWKTEDGDLLEGDVETILGHTFEETCHWEVDEHPFTNFVDQALRFNQESTIIRWAFFAVRPGRLWLQVYRATDDPHVFHLVHETEQNVTSLGPHNITLEESFSVHAGDYIGWRFGEDGGVVGFEDSGEGRVHFTDPFMPDANQLVPYNTTSNVTVFFPVRFVHESTRTYALRAEFLPFCKRLNAEERAALAIAEAERRRRLGLCLHDCSGHGDCVNSTCFCQDGWIGEDCSQQWCPRNCSGRGRCVALHCHCNGGFSGVACEEMVCPNNCSNNGQCKQGACYCNIGFTGADCSEVVEDVDPHDVYVTECPKDCLDRGRCIFGICVCYGGFDGEDCGRYICPNNCTARGPCVHGACVCPDGYQGDTCAVRACPGSCNNQGVCLDNGTCQCYPGYSGDACLLGGDVCPNKCSGNGLCTNGVCHCNPGYAEEDCSRLLCPKDCSDHGLCMDNGVCACHTDYGGPDCSIRLCRNDCMQRGPCVDGACQCEGGYGGEDCSQVRGGLVVHLPFTDEEDLGHDASDSSLTPKVLGSPKPESGPNGTSAVLLEGKSDAFLLKEEGVDLGDVWTIATWIRLPLPDTSHWHVLARGYAGNSPCIVKPNGDEIGSYDNLGESGFHPAGFRLSEVQPGWRHLTILGKDGSTHFYLDGVFRGEADHQTTTDIFSVGNVIQGESGSDLVWGALADFRIYQRALPLEQILVLAGHGPLPSRSKVIFDTFLDKKVPSYWTFRDPGAHGQQLFTNGELHITAAAHSDLWDRSVDAAPMFLTDAPDNVDYAFQAMINPLGADRTSMVPFTQCGLVLFDETSWSVVLFGPSSSRSTDLRTEYCLNGGECYREWQLGNGLREDLVRIDETVLLKIERVGEDFVFYAKSSEADPWVKATELVDHAKYFPHAQIGVFVKSWGEDATGVLVGYLSVIPNPTEHAVSV